MIQDRFLRLPEVIRLTGYSCSSVYLLMSRGEFPKTYKLGGRAVAWRESDIQAWINTRVQRQDSVAA